MTKESLTYRHDWFGSVDKNEKPSYLLFVYYKVRSAGFVFNVLNLSTLLTITFRLFLLLTFFFVINSSFGHASHFFECVLDYLSFFLKIDLSLYFPSKIGYPSYTLQPKGLTFPGSQHPPFFQLVLRRSKLLLTPVTASVSFCFV